MGSNIMQLVDSVFFLWICVLRRNFRKSLCIHLRDRSSCVMSCWNLQRRFTFDWLCWPFFFKKKKKNDWKRVYITLNMLARLLEYQKRLNNNTRKKTKSLIFCCFTGSSILVGEHWFAAFLQTARRKAPIWCV